MGLVEGGVDLAGRSRRPDRRQRAASDHEVTGSVGESDHRVEGLGDIDQLFVADRLEVAALVGHDVAPRSLRASARSAGTADELVLAPLFERLPRGNSMSMDGRVPRDAGDDLGELDGLGDVVDEVHEHCQVDQ